MSLEPTKDISCCKKLAQNLKQNFLSRNYNARILKKVTHPLQTKVDVIVAVAIVVCVIVVAVAVAVSLVAVVVVVVVAAVVNLVAGASLENRKL